MRKSVKQGTKKVAGPDKKIAPPRGQIRLPIAPDVWDEIRGTEEGIVFTSVVGWGNRSAVCAWLRSDKPLRREMRDLIADFLEGKYKKAAHRPSSCAKMDQHNYRRTQLKQEQVAIAADLKAKGSRAPMEDAKEVLCKRWKFTESQLKRALAAFPAPKF